jgi:quercetin dioxygenase-like cupin family protein
MGFNKHNDSSNNFIVLCEGKIKVEVWNDSKVTRIMNPGEYVFIPSHTDHRIIPLSDKRLSCSFPIVEHKSAFDEREWLTL